MEVWSIAVVDRSKYNLDGIATELMLVIYDENDEEVIRLALAKDDTYHIYKKEEISVLLEQIIAIADTKVG